MEFLHLVGGLSVEEMQAVLDAAKSWARRYRGLERFEGAEADWALGEVGLESFREQKAAIRAEAEKKGTWMKAPNGKASNLSEEQWCAVRTKAFKEWFGDWETLARIRLIQSLQATTITPNESLDKAGMKSAFAALGEVTNTTNKRKVRFPSASAGKIHYHKGFDTSTIVGSFGRLFEEAMPAFDLPEIRMEGHKYHSNHERYENYVNKFRVNGETYYIRFTVPIVRNSKPPHNVHSTAISEIAVYKEGDSAMTPRNTAGSGNLPFVDTKLADFFASVKAEDVSKVVDENGEPLVVYHYTDEQFSAFNPAKARVNSDIQALFFMDNAMDWQDMGERKMECFLNIRKPVEKPMVDAKRNEAGRVKRDELIAQGYDGTFLTEDGATEWAAFYPEQIKSVDNRGTWDVGQDNINFSIRTKEPPKKTGIGYKVFYRGKDGKLYPPMVANPDGADTPVGVWLDADEGVRAADSKTGRAQVKAGGKGTQGGSGTLSFRPGWHLGEIPYAIQFNRVNPLTGKKELFPRDFVWAEVEYAADVDYQDEAMSYGYTDKGKFRHSYAGLPHLPKDGFYTYRTNPNPETEPWIITGAMKVNRVLSQSEVDEIVRNAGREPQRVEGVSFALSEVGRERAGELDELRLSYRPELSVNVREAQFNGKFEPGEGVLEEVRGEYGERAAERWDSETEDVRRRAIVYYYYNREVEGARARAEAEGYKEEYKTVYLVNGREVDEAAFNEARKKRNELIAEERLEGMAEEKWSKWNRWGAEKKKQLLGTLRNEVLRYEAPSVKKEKRLVKEIELPKRRVYGELSEAEVAEAWEAVKDDVAADIMEDYGNSREEYIGRSVEEDASEIYAEANQRSYEAWYEARGRWLDGVIDLVGEELSVHGFRVSSQDSSRVSDSKYFYVERVDDADGDDGVVKVRLSDHEDYHGSDVNVRFGETEGMVKGVLERVHDWFGVEDMHDVGGVDFSVAEAKEQGIMQDGKLDATNGTLYDMGGVSFSILARHASPHSGIRKFLMEFIGTGEGAQVYGHGMYFSTNEGVHRSYVRQFRNRYKELVRPADNLPSDVTKGKWLKRVEMG